MPNQDDRCPKCGSTERIPNVTVVSKGAEGMGGVLAEVNRHPRALLLKDPRSSELRATVCGNCGFTELYVAQPRELLAAYRESQSPKERT